MPTHPEVVRLNLEYYRKQAKALLKAVKAGDPSALQRLRCHPKLKPSKSASPFPALHDAQLAIAREQGFASWPRFQAFLVESQLDFQGLVTAFIDAALSHGELRVSMEELEVAAGGPLDGRRVADLRDDGIFTLAIVHGEGDYEPNPPPDRVLAAGESLVVSGSTERLGALRERV